MLFKKPIKILILVVAIIVVVFSALDLVVKVRVCSELEETIKTPMEYITREEMDRRIDYERHCRNIKKYLAPLASFLFFSWAIKNLSQPEKEKGAEV